MMLETPIFEPKKKKMINIFFNLFGVYYYNTYLCNRFQEARAFSSASALQAEGRRFESVNAHKRRGDFRLPLFL